ncbi:MAG: flagellar hook-length control protein FliK [Pseudomonadota bacterium]
MELPIFPARLVEGNGQEGAKGVDNHHRLKSGNEDAASSQSEKKSDDSFADHMEKSAEPDAKNGEATASDHKKAGDHHARDGNTGDRKIEKKAEHINSSDNKESLLITADLTKIDRTVEKQPALAINTKTVISTGEPKIASPVAAAVQAASNTSLANLQSVNGLQFDVVSKEGGGAIVLERQKLDGHAVSSKNTLNSFAPVLANAMTAKTVTAEQGAIVTGTDQGVIELQTGLQAPTAIVADELTEAEIPTAPVFKATKTAALTGQAVANAAPTFTLQSGADSTSLKDGELEIKPLMGGHENLVTTKPGLVQTAQVTPSSQPAAATSANAAAQLVAAIRTEAKTGNIEVRLDPPEMGRVRINLSIETADAVKAILTVERPETLDHLRRNMSQFIDDLKMAGFASVDLEFSEQSGSGFNDEPDGFDVDSTPGYVAETAPGNIVYLAMRDDVQLDLLV